LARVINDHETRRG